MTTENPDLSGNRENITQSPENPSFWKKFRNRIGLHKVEKPPKFHPSKVVLDLPIITTATARLYDREVDPSQLSVYKLPLEWSAFKKLGSEINKVKDPDDQVSPIDIASLKPSENAYVFLVFLPMVASVIAHRKNPDYPIQTPTDAQIKNLMPWLNRASKILDKFTPTLGSRFDRYIERRGAGAVVDIGNKLYETASAIGEIANPRDQFFSDISNMYLELATPEITRETGFFETYETVRPIEDKIEETLTTMSYVRMGYRRHDAQMFAQKYPLLAKIAPIAKFPPDTMDIGRVSIAGAEMMQGIRRYLTDNGIKNVLPTPKPKEFDLFDLDTYMRWFAEWFAEKKLHRVRHHLPTILNASRKCLPENGPQLANAIIQRAEDVVVLNNQGIPNKQIVDHLFRNS